MKLKELIDSTDISPALVRAVVSQIGSWEYFQDTAPDIANHGIDGGYAGFTYYVDTLAFARKHRAKIAKLAEGQAEEYGMGVLEMIQGFGCLGKDYSLGEIGKCLYGRGDDTQILNGLAWYAGEEVCRVYNDLIEQRLEL